MSTNATQELPNDEWLAAVDLGSNSFHMIIAYIANGELRLVDKLKEMVRLGGGLREDGSLDKDTRKRALDTLARFGERVRHMPVGTVRAVGTNTLRKAKNTRMFLMRAQHELGHPIEIVSGREEGRLIYLGVAHGISDDDNTNRLVVDIGGGSTEVIIGRGFDMLECESLYMGCVSFSNTYFPEGRLSQKRFDKAVLAARQELRAIEHTYPKIGWTKCIGASGSVKAAHKAILSLFPDILSVSLEHLYAVRDHLVDAGHMNDVQDLNIDEERAPVFPGGLAVLIGVFESLGLHDLLVSESAMREGLLYDLFGRMYQEDIRDLTIMNLANRYHVDTAFAQCVEDTAIMLCEQVASIWNMNTDAFKTRLRWACRIHEIGLAISHSRHHLHGSYLVENSDMAGFSRQDQQLLWALVRTHRRSFKPHRFANLPHEWSLQGQRLCVLLRLAIVLNRSRGPDSVPQGIDIKVGASKIKLKFPKGWLDQAPLTAVDLEQEAHYLADAGFRLRFE